MTDRLGVLDDLEALLFDRGKREYLKERAELHRILENGNTWVFGEDYSLAVSERGLTEVLKAHIRLLGRDDLIGTVTDAEGGIRRVDLMLSKAARLRDHRHHLVVELKRPSVRLGMLEYSQVFDYATAVAEDDRFKTPDVQWDFWLVGDSMDATLTRQANPADNPSGLAYDGDRIRIWVRLWAEILEENRQRLHFYREHLEYRPAEDVGLQETLDKYLRISTNEDAEAPASRPYGQ